MDGKFNPKTQNWKDDVWDLTRHGLEARRTVIWLKYAEGWIFMDIPCLCIAWGMVLFMHTWRKASIENEFNCFYSVEAVDACDRT